MLTIAIIGGGFSGTALVAQILKQTQTLQRTQPFKLLLIEKRAFARGSICETTSPLHLLNIQATFMSAFPEDPDHFFNWLVQQGYSTDPLVFAPRILYSQYLDCILQEAEALASQTCQIEKILDEVIAVHPTKNQYSVLLADHRTILADIVVLAMGNFPIHDLPVKNLEYLKHPSYQSNSWGTLPPLPSNCRIALIGTGLTSVDKLLEIQAMNHQGKIYAISRHGLFPLPISYTPASIDDYHQRMVETPPPLSFDFDLTARSILKAFQLGNKSGASFEEFRYYFLYKMGVKSANGGFLSQMPPEETKKFTRHLKRYFSRLIHTAPRASIDSLNTMQDTGQLTVYAGKLKSITVTTDGFNIEFSKRFLNQTETLPVDIIINCVGAVTQAQQCKNTLLSQLSKKGLIRPNLDGLLLDTTPSHQVVDAQGNIQNTLFAIGSLKKTSLNSIQPVPYLSFEARNLAAHLINTIYEKS